MFVKALNRRPGETPAAAPDPILNFRVLFFLGCMFFLLAWSFMGRNLRLELFPVAGAHEVNPLVVIGMLHLAGFMFYLLYKKIIHRTIIIITFAAKILFVGTVIGFYKPMDALFAIRFDTLSLLLGLGIISVILDKAGFFNYMAERVAGYAGGNLRRAMVLFCLMSFACSLVVNNLTTILIVVPITLKLAARLRFDPRPLVIGEIIASNIGGASTMVGDFPNMLISTETGISFNQFIVFMMPPCLIFLAILLVFLSSRAGNCRLAEAASADSDSQPVVNQTATNRTLAILAVVVILFVFGNRLALNPASVALGGGLAAFFLCGLQRNDILRSLNYDDIIFFIGLFIVVGAIEATGFLNRVTDLIIFLSGGRVWLSCLFMMWLAALMTAFLNAGPSTAFFLPVVAGLSINSGTHIEWWALSLGVLAGSSATIIGATAGPVAVTMVENFYAEHDLEMSEGNTITSEQFSRIGLGMAAMILGLSNIYIIFLSFILVE